MKRLPNLRVVFLLVILLACILGWNYGPFSQSSKNDPNGTTNSSLASSEKASVDADMIKQGAITFDKLSPETVKSIQAAITSTATSEDSSSTAVQTTSTTDFVSLSAKPATGSIAGSFSDGFTINQDAIILGTDTVGDYIKSVVAGSGLLGGAGGEGGTVSLSIGAGDGISVAEDSVSISLRSGGGLSLSSSALSLLTSCADGQVLKWNGVSSAWACGSDSTGGGGGSLTIRETDGTPAVLNVSNLEFGPVTDSSGEFVVTDEGSGTARVRTGSLVPLTNTTATISAAWTFSSEIVANGGISCTNCVALGTETSGDYVAGVLAGSGLSVSGSGGEAATPTVSLDSSLAMFKTINASLGTDPVADSLTDSLSLSSGNGVNVTGDAATDSVAFDLNLASGSGLVFSGSALTLLNTCTDGQVLKWNSTSTSWECATNAISPDLFKTLSGDSGNAVADGATDSIIFVGGDGLTSVAADAPDTITFNIDLASGSGLSFSGGGLTLQSCSDGQILKRVAGAWACSGDISSLAAAYHQHTSTEVTVGSSLTALLKNDSNVATSLPITITSGNYVEFTATIEASTSLTTGPITYTVVRDDNLDNDCVTTAGDGTRVGAWIDDYLVAVGQTSTTSFSFIDNAPGTTSPQYQLCASTTIATGTVKTIDRSLKLKEWKP